MTNVPDKRVLLAGLDHVFKEDLGGEGVAVVDDGLPVLPVPAVQLHAPASQLGVRELHTVCPRSLDPSTKPSPARKYGFFIVCFIFLVTM